MKHFIYPLGGMALTTIWASAALAHDPLTPADVQKFIANGDYQQRLARIRQIAPHQMNESLSRKARYKIAKAALTAQGLSPAEISDRLFGGGRMMAFPFAAQPELRSSGTVRTVTILVDFKDKRAENLLPGLTPDIFQQNIYGTGTAAAQMFVPFESVHSYYQRASQGKVDLQGDVLGWVHLSKNRSEYEPVYPPGADDNERARIDNQAIFDMFSEAMTSLDADHDFAQYDNDNDGDIDLVTFMYAGPDTGWGGFWWAYRWQFFVNDAFNKTFDGKRVHQFVFQFINQRNGNDFAPNTLMHEMGHAFGLADYYDYKPGEGPDGGVGGLDMMDHNWGNQCAFSRWLLDWIEPEVIGAAPPTVKQLTASGSTAIGTKAIAIFPELSRADAPDQEMFMIENRFQVGNDAGQAQMPGSGLLIWHIDATPNADNSNFEMNNSYSARKLIRLMRADSGEDFSDGESASSGTYFRKSMSFTPSSTPNSNDYVGHVSNVSVTDLGDDGEVMEATIGIIPAGPVPTPPPAAPGEVAGAGASAPATTPAVASTAPTTARVALIEREMSSVLSKPAAPQPHAQVVDLAKLEEYLADFSAATPAQMRELWEKTSKNYNLNTAAVPREASALLQLILAQWAAKDGQSAIKAVLELPSGEFRTQSFKQVMDAWAGQNAYRAGEWYFAPEQKQVRESPQLEAGEMFAQKVIRHSGQNSADEAVKAIDQLRHPQEVWGAVQALETLRDNSQLSAAKLDQKLQSLKNNKELVQSIRQFRAAAQKVQSSIRDPEQQRRMRDLMSQHAQSATTSPTK